MGDRNPSKDRISEEIKIFSSVDENPKMNFSGEQRFGTFERDIIKLRRSRKNVCQEEFQKYSKGEEGLSTFGESDLF